MAPEYRSIAMRANRLLGAALVEANLITIDSLEKANERLLELMNSENAQQVTLLGILAYELKVLREEDVLEHLVSNEGIGLIDPRDFEVNEELRKALSLEGCWATWSVPFDREEEFVLIASAYYLSPAVRNHWEKIYGPSIIWYGTTLDVVSDMLERFGKEREAN